jgi:hypothetical protein
MTNQSSIVLAAADGPWAQLRTGTVVEATGSTVVVLVGAATFTASIIAPFGISDPSTAVPPVGTLVAVGRQDSSWTVFGSILGASGNLLLNGSFEDSPTGSPPDNWVLYNASGVAEALVENVGSPVAGTQVLAVTAITPPSISIVYSSPVEVTAGERYQLSVFAGAEYAGTAAQDADATLLALWFADDVALYPTTASPDTTIATATDVVPSPPWTPLSGSVLAPITGVLRLGLQSSVAADQTILWDFATVRMFG